jgi:hypothetical protein
LAAAERPLKDIVRFAASPHQKPPVCFKDSGGGLHGSTSVAIETE